MNAETDINRLHYFVTNALTGERHEVYFAPLLPEDEAELRGADWSRAVYRDVWPVYVGDPKTIKLVCAGESTREILGIARIGEVEKRKRFVWKSLLETAPSNRAGTQKREFEGVGRALVARLVAESYRAGGNGRVIVIPRPGSEKFYSKLGFRKGELKGLELETRTRQSCLRRRYGKGKRKAMENEVCERFEAARRTIVEMNRLAWQRWPRRRTEAEANAEVENAVCRLESNGFDIIPDEAYLAKIRAENYAGIGSQPGDPDGVKEREQSPDPEIRKRVEAADRLVREMMRQEWLDMGISAEDYDESDRCNEAWHLLSAYGYEGLRPRENNDEDAPYSPVIIKKLAAQT